MARKQKLIERRCPRCNARVLLAKDRKTGQVVILDLGEQPCWMIRQTAERGTLAERYPTNLHDHTIAVVPEHAALCKETKP